MSRTVAVDRRSGRATGVAARALGGEHIDVETPTTIFHLCEAAVDHMGPGASIIDTTSIREDQPTPMLLPYAATMPAEAVEGVGDNTPLGRVAQPAEVAPAYALLASDGRAAAR